MKLPGKSVARLLKPVNLDEAERRFHESGSSPELKYASDVSAVFKQNSEVDFSLERLAELIINQPDSSADDHPLVTGNELLKAMKEYVQLLDLEHIVIFRQTLNALALANVLKPGSLDRKLIVHYNPEATLPLSLVPGVCAHELGTHLLRMINDDLQVWRKAGRKKYRLSCHMATEEGLATLNTLVASNERSLRHSALNYWAVCQAAKISFTNLYHKLAAYMPDANKRFRLCIRVKRGLVHTDKPGACTLDQNYFLGAVDILRNLESTDLRLLYCGQIARVDLPRLKPVLTMRQVRLPPFLATPEAYRTHVRCLLMIRELNGIDAVSSVPRPLAEQVIDDDKGELMLNSPKGGVIRSRLSSADTTTGSLMGNSTSSHLNDEDLGKFRTKFCERKIIYGYCDHGGGWGCNFSHNLKWQRRNAQKQKYAPRLCASFPACINGVNCQYAHSREEQFYHPSIYKRLPCLSFPQCRLGQLCPFTHGLSDQFIAASDQLCTEDLYQLVDQQTSVILHTLSLSAEKLVHAVAELELEHDPGVRVPDSMISSCPGRLRGGSLLDVLNDFQVEREVAPSGPGDDIIADRFISLLKGERGFMSYLASDDSTNSTRHDDASNWKSICKDIVISVSSGKVGVYLGGACVAFEGRMESHSGFSCAFGQPGDEKMFRECLVIRCTKSPHFTTSLAGLVSPIRVETDAKNGWVGIFEVNGCRTLKDFLMLEKKLEDVPVNSSNCLLEDCDGQLPPIENIPDFLLAVKEDRDLLVRQFIIQMIKILEAVHCSGRCLGGFTLEQWQFASGSVDKLLLLPVFRSSKVGATSAVTDDVRSLGIGVAQLLVGSEVAADVSSASAWLGVLAEKRGGLAWDFVVRCVFRAEKETMTELLRHPFLWSWTNLASVLMRGVAAWFQQSGLLFKPNAQRHLINWAESSFGCTRNEGVPVRRQVFRLAAYMDWVPASSSSGCANVVSTLALDDKRASPCLVVDNSKVNLVKSPGCHRIRDNLLAMLPLCCNDSHLELLLQPVLRGKAQSFSKIIEQLLHRFHLTERTSVYSFLSFLLFVLANPHLCMDADVISTGSQAALIRRHRAVVCAVANSVPLGMLMTCQLAEADSLLDPLISGGFNSPKRIRSPTTLLLDGRFL